MANRSLLEKLPVMEITATDPHNGNKEVKVLVDGDYDGEYFAQYRYRLNQTGYVEMWPYTTPLFDDSTGIQVGSTKNASHVYLHHLVLPPRKGYWTRFVNGNKLDCRSVNLEYATPPDSALRRAQGRRSSAGYRGVRPLRDGRGCVSKTTWVAYCNKKYLGTFKSPELAAKAYDKVARELWGDRAQLNFMEV